MNLLLNFIIIFIIGMDLEQGEKPPTKRRYRGITRKSMIIKNQSRGVKLVIKYNPNSIYVGLASNKFFRRIGTHYGAN